MVFCLNPDCPDPQNPGDRRFCLNCGSVITPLLRNHYEVITLLGQGGFGRTYLAKDRDKLDQLCVVKQLVLNSKGTGVTKKAIKLFELEARQLEKLGENTPHIPYLYAYFKQNGYLYLVQQFIEGQDLAKELKQQGVWKEEEVKELLLELLPVLQLIHEQGVIHRDIKPQNIMRRCLSTKIGKSGGLVLIDFGISKQLSSRVVTNLIETDIANFNISKKLSSIVAKTTAGTSIGSYGYAAIEQMRDGKAYPASDLFSLGTTCFNLLTNISPFDLLLEYGYGWTDNWQKYLKSDISNELARVIDKLLQKDFKERYESAEEAIKDLENFATVPGILPTQTKPFDKTNINSSYNDPTYLLQETKKNITTTAAKLTQGLSIIVVILLGFSITQLYGWRRYELSPFKQIFLITSLHSKSLLQGTSQGHSDYVDSVAFSPDIKTLASGSWDNTIKLWNVDNKEKVVTLTGHLSSVKSVAFSPDGKTLASGSWDNTIKLWDVETGQKTATFTQHSEPVNSVAFSPDGKILASASLDNTIKLWNLEANLEITTITIRADGVISLAFSSDGKTLASGSYDNTIKLWNLETKKIIATLTGHSDDVVSVAFSPDGKILASGSRDDTIKLWRVP